MTRPAKLSLQFSLIGAMACVAATKQAADQLIDRLRSCATEVNEAKHLACYDAGQIWSPREVLDFPLQVGNVVTVRHGVLGVLWMSHGRRGLETRRGR